MYVSMFVFWCASMYQHVINTLHGRDKASLQRTDPGDARNLHRTSRRENVHPIWSSDGLPNKACAEIRSKHPRHTKKGAHTHAVVIKNDTGTCLPGLRQFWAQYCTLPKRIPHDGPGDSAQYNMTRIMFTTSKKRT